MTEWIQKDQLRLEITHNPDGPCSACPLLTNDPCALGFAVPHMGRDSAPSACPLRLGIAVEITGSTEEEG